MVFHKEQCLIEMLHGSKVQVLVTFFLACSNASCSLRRCLRFPIRRAQLIAVFVLKKCGKESMCREFPSRSRNDSATSCAGSVPHERNIACRAIYKLVKTISIVPDISRGVLPFWSGFHSIRFIDGLNPSKIPVLAYEDLPEAGSCRFWDVHE